MIPLAADLSPPNRRAQCMAIVLSGLLMGILIARVLSGIIAQVSFMTPPVGGNEIFNRTHLGY